MANVIWYEFQCDSCKYMERHSSRPLGKNEIMRRLRENNWVLNTRKDNPKVLCGDCNTRGEEIKTLNGRVGQRIAQERRRQKLKQEDLSKLIDLSSSQLSLAESGKKRLTLRTFRRICIALGCSADYLLEVG